MPQLPDIHHGSIRHRLNKRSLPLSAAPHDAPCRINDEVSTQRIRAFLLVHMLRLATCVVFLIGVQPPDAAFGDLLAATVCTREDGQNELST